jgi:hypothetical protein
MTQDIVLRWKGLIASQVTCPDPQVEMFMVLNPLMSTRKCLVCRQAILVETYVRLKIGEDVSSGIEVSSLLAFSTGRSEKHTSTVVCYRYHGLA